MRRPPTPAATGCIALFCLALPAAAPASDLVFHDPFEKLTTKRKRQYTNAVAYGKPRGPAQGEVRGQARIVEGREGKALQLSGDTRILYRKLGPLNLLGGEVSFWVKLNFDPNDRNEKTRTILRNQMFVSFHAPGRGYFSFYTVLTNVAFLIRNNQRNMIAVKGIPFKWERGVWHRLKVRWGNELEMWADGKMLYSQPWDGLFGPIPAEKEKLLMFVGYHDPHAIDSEFTIDELVIRGPEEGNLGCRPRMALPLLDGAPTIDGKLDDPFWKSACQVSGFVGFAERVLVRNPSAVLAAYTKDGIYIGLDASLPDGRPPRASLTSRDAAIYREDTLEIFFQPSRFAPSYYQFMASAIGAKLDLTKAPHKRPDMGYDPDWGVKTTGQAGQWTAEIHFPYQALGLSGPPKAGEVWRGNFVLDSANGFPDAASWAFTDGDFTNPASFGEMLFTGRHRTLRQERFVGFTDGSPVVDFRLVGPFPPALTVRGEIFDALGNRVHDESIRMNDSKTVAVRTRFLQAGQYLAKLSAIDEAGTEFLRQNVFFRTEKSFALAVENYPYAGVAEFTANLGPIKDKVNKVTFHVLSTAERPVGTVCAQQLRGASSTAKFATAKLEPGEYVVAAVALDAAGNQLENAEHALKIFPKPKWWKNNIGIDHSVPPPFEPVRATKKGYGVWGRDYRFEGTAFPRQVTSQGTPLLAAPPTLEIRVDGKTTDLLTAPAAPKGEQFPDQVTLTASQKIAGLDVAASGSLEFDGCYRFDLRLTPAGAARIDTVGLKLPFSSSIAQFLLISNGNTSSISEIKGPVALPFTPYLWIGNDDMGLAVFTESDQYWRPRDQKMIEIVPSGKAVLLRLNILRSPLEVKVPITLTVGLMASPVRPLAADNDPFQHLIYSGPAQVVWPEFLVYPATGRLSPKQGTVEFLARLSNAGRGKSVELFHFAGPKPGPADLHAYAVPTGIYVNIGDKTRLLTANTPLKPDRFTHVAFAWDKKHVSLYVDGKRAASGPATDAFLAAAKRASASGGQLRFGCAREYRGFTAIVLDDIRLSAIARYGSETATGPASPPGKDAHTTLVDPLDQTFVPDGQDAYTTAGGRPSIGCRFIKGKTGQALRLEVAPPRPAREVAKELGATFGLAWNWNFDGRAQLGWPPVFFGPVQKDLKQVVKNYHSYGLKIMPYTGYPAVGGPSPLVDQFGSEWGRKPVSILPYPPPEGHYMFNVSSGARGFADYHAAGTAWVMDEFGFDGIYTDGFAAVSPSQNLYHGAGYRDENGHLRPTVPIFNVRETMKRLYRIVKARKPDGMIINHLSYNLLLPTMSFSDIYYTGEHEDYENLGQARLRFSSRPWGLQASLLGSSEHIYSSLHTMIALLHGTPIMGHGIIGRNDLSRKLMNIRKAYQRASTKSARWVPYFRNEDKYWSADDPKLLISLYYHPGKQALLIVGNLNPEPKDVSAQLHLDSFGLAPTSVRAWNALTQTPLMLTPDGTLRAPIAKKSFVLVRIAPLSPK